MKRDIGVFLEDILESIELIEKRMEEISYEKFISDIDLQDMIIFKNQLEQILQGIDANKDVTK